MFDVVFNIRRMPLWRMALVNHEDFFDAFFPPVMLSAIALPALIGLAVDCGLAWFVVVPAIVYLTVMSVLLFGKYLSPLYGMKGDGTNHYRYHRDGHSELYDEAVKYIALPKSDRANYPSDILSVAKDPDLTGRQARNLASSMQRIRLEIEKRDAARAELNRRYPDISVYLESMNDFAESIRVETDTYREFAEGRKEIL